MKIVPKESKPIYSKNIFIVAWFLVFSYGSHLNTISAAAMWQKVA